METYSNRVANYFLSRGYAKGDSVALFMENRPEYVGLWMGLAKIGVIPALINYNLQQDSLLHTINVAECRAIIYGLELEEGNNVAIIFVKKNNQIILIERYAYLKSIAVRSYPKFKSSRQKKFHICSCFVIIFPLNVKISADWV